jgi:hypothetical protein
MDTQVISWISLAMACVLALERIMKRVKHCESGCCKVDMETSSPKHIETSKI